MGLDNKGNKNVSIYVGYIKIGTRNTTEYNQINLHLG